MEAFPEVEAHDENSTSLRMVACKKEQVLVCASLMGVVASL